MNETFFLGAAIGAIAAAVVLVRMRSGGPEPSALWRLEAKLDALLKHAGVQFDPLGDAPPLVVDAIRRGQKIEAIREYRAATGADLKAAKDFVEALERRGVPRV
jgi:hypothetical protein